MKLLRYIFLVLLVIVIVGGGILAFTVYRWTQGPLPQHAGEITLTGLTEEVRIVRDDWGIPHIYASTLEDLLFAQGYTHAQDRWWQMEFFRHTGNGTLQELTGQTASLASTDIFIRVAGWRASAEEDFEHIQETQPELAAYLQTFADGVNAYITGRSAGELAFEYNILGLTGVNIEIEPWTPVDTLVWTEVMSWDLGGNQSLERDLSDLLAALPEEMVEDLLPEYPFDEKPPIILESEIPDSGTFEKTLAASEAGLKGIKTQLAGNFDDSQGLAFGRGEGIGSNNWVVHGSKTASGTPLLADDPHLGIQMPSIWYEIGLHCEPVSDACPVNVTGFTFSPSPFIIVGHNDYITWGVTNIGPDTQDLYRINVNPENDLQYEWNGEWRDMTVREEVIRYGDSDETLTIEVRETHLGPIITDHQLDDDGNLTGFINDDALALHWTSLEEPTTLLQAIYGLNLATNWDEFREALRYWDTAAQNFVYADIEGNIGYQATGNFPVRVAGHSGRLPVDGSTDEFEWKGYIPYEYLPSLLNPERGFISTANQALVPPAYYDYLASELSDEFGDDANYMIDYYWAYGYRGQRIFEMLEARDDHSFQTFQEIQGDNKMIVAEEIAPYLADLDFEDETLTDAMTWMLDWDYQMHMDSPQAALFAYFWRTLVRQVYVDQLQDIVSPGGGGNDMWSMVLLSEEAENIWWDDAGTEDTVETRDDILARAFEDAYQTAVDELGDDRDAWSWGAIHTATFVSNPLGVSGIDLIENMVNRGPYPTSGGSSIVNATSWSASSDHFRLRALPSMRMIVDTGDFSTAQTMHTTGQSGHPFSPHYDSMPDAWRNIEFHTMLWTPEQVDAAATTTLILKPE